MKKTGKKFLSILLSVMLVFSVLTPAAFAAEADLPEEQQIEPVREYIYEINPVHGFRVDAGVTSDQVRVKLREKRPTTTVTGSQGGQYVVPLKWDSVYERYNRFIEIISIKGRLENEEKDSSYFPDYSFFYITAK